MEEELMEIVSKVLADDLPWLDADLDEFAGRIASAILSAGYVKKDEIRQQLLEKLGEKKCHIIIAIEKKFKCDTCSCNIERCRLSGYNQFHDRITSIINEVFTIEKKEV